MADLYAVLGVASSANAEELRSAFKRHALQQHPDKGGSKEAFHQIMLAYETLSDPCSRQKYDRRWVQEGSRVGSGCVEPATRKKARCQHYDQEPSASDAKATGPGNVHIHARQPNATKASPSGDGRREWKAGKQSNIVLDERRAKQRNRILKRLFALMQRLTPETRHRFLSSELSQGDRLSLETWITNSKDGAAASGDVPDKIASEEDVSGHTDPESATSDANLSPSTYRSHWAALADGKVGSNGASSSSDATSDEEPLEFLCDGVTADATVETQPVNNVGANWPSKKRRTALYKSSKVRGIKSVGNRYQAVNSISFVTLLSQSSTELAQALDYLVVLTDVVQRAKTYDDLEFGDRMEKALQVAFAEHSTTYEALGLSFRIRIRYGFWIGRNKLNSPRLNIKSALAAIGRLHPLCNHRPRIAGPALIGQVGLAELRSQWDEFKQSYLDICEQGGWCRVRCSDKLAKLEAATEPVRERSCEKWNRSVMRKEDSRSRQFCRPSESLECRLERRAFATLALWRRFETRQAANAHKVAAEERARERQRARKEAREQRAIREAQWRRMMRPDITMDEILGAQAFPAR